MQVHKSDGYFTFWSALAMLVAIASGCSGHSSTGPGPATATSNSKTVYTQLEGSYLERRANHKTQLKPNLPPPAKGQPLNPPANFETVTYRSGELDLQAYYAAPLADSAKRPGVVFFHGDFALHQRAFTEVEPFIAAGFAVMLPTLRAENGNPGRFELLYGEVDDARAAVRWLAARPEVEGNKIYAFGHSVGGGIAAMLSLHPEPPLAGTGSSGGIYVPATFSRWRNGPNKYLIRFDPEDPLERTLRVLGPNISDMVHPHVAYVGTEDRWFIDNAAHVRELAKQHGRPFTVEHVPGDHMTALVPSITAFVASISGEK